MPHGPPKSVARIGQLAQSIPHGLLVRVVCEIAEEYPQVGELMLQRLEKAEFNLHMQQQYLNMGQHAQMMGGPGLMPDMGLMHMRKEELWQQWSGPMGMGPEKRQQQGVPAVPMGARKPRPYNSDTEQMLCSKHNTTRSKKHLTYNGNDWECVPGFHCLESRPATPPVQSHAHHSDDARVHGEQIGLQPTPPQ
eukprot:TRINITY_DN1019_c0_g1_i1.p1 TRINITY_DN1019_c0_g1~~TRINITY_DN1019_c0_g1_i1.p1  ORF type:complete len:193 (+),score=29.98 TRINITY_DN1019_c0_g1_i1:392-970(+)